MACLAAVAPRRRSRSNHSDTMRPPAEWPYSSTFAPPVADDDDVQRALQLDVVAGQIGGEVRGLAIPPGPAALVQVEGVEGEATVDEVVGDLGVEEVVGEPVHQQHRVFDGRLSCSPARIRVATSSPSPSGSRPSVSVCCQ